MGGYSLDGDGLISTSEINACLDGVAYGISIGLPVDLGLIGDTQVSSDFSAANLPRAKAQLTKICQQIVLRNFDLTMLCLHNVNEYGGYDSNTVINPLNVALDAIIRGFLPTVPLLRKGGEWGNYAYAMATDLAAPLDPEYLLGCHSYENLNAATAATVAGGMQGAVVRGGYAGWIWEECGFGDLTRSRMDPASVWTGNWQAIIPAVAANGGAAAAWCITRGSDWKMNNADLTLTTACAAIMSWMSAGGATWPPLGRLGIASGPVVTPPTPPVVLPAPPAVATVTADKVVVAVGNIAFTGTVSQPSVPVQMVWYFDASGTPPATSPYWRPVIIDPAKLTWSATTLVPSDAAGSLWTMVAGVITRQFSAVPTDPVVVPPVVTPPDLVTPALALVRADLAALEVAITSQYGSKPA